MDLSSWLTGIALGAVVALLFSSLSGTPLRLRVPNIVAAFVGLATYALLAAINVTPAVFLAAVVSTLAWFLTNRMRSRTGSSTT